MPAVATPAIVPPPPPSKGGAQTVLVVDPSGDMLRQLGDALEESGYTVVGVSAPDAACEAAADAEVVAVLADADALGDQAGVLARRLREPSRAQPLPLLFLSSLPGGESGLRDAALAPLVVLTRPVRLSALLDRLAECLRSARQTHRGLLDAFGHAAMVLRARDGRRLWQTALARRLMQEHFPNIPETLAPPEVTAWAARESLRQGAGADPHPLTVARGARRLSFSLHRLPAELDDEWMLVLTEVADHARLQALARRFTALEARDVELLLRLGQGACESELARSLGCDAEVVQERLRGLCEALQVQTQESAARLARSALAEAGRPLPARG